VALFPGLPGWAGARRNKLLLDFMVQGKITEAGTPSIWMGATPSGLISDPPLSSHHFYARCPSKFLAQPSHFILAWDRHQIYQWLGRCTTWQHKEKLNARVWLQTLQTASSKCFLNGLLLEQNWLFQSMMDKNIKLLCLLVVCAVWCSLYSPWW